MLMCVAQLLEYVGRGKSIIDVGLAQARHPLTTRYHYFELQIVDPGENCYVAIGLARRVHGLLKCSDNNSACFFISAAMHDYSFDLDLVSNSVGVVRKGSL